MRGARRIHSSVKWSITSIAHIDTSVLTFVDSVRVMTFVYIMIRPPRPTRNQRNPELCYISHMPKLPLENVERAPFTPHPVNGLPRVKVLTPFGQPAYDWPQIMPTVFGRLADGATLSTIAGELGMSLGSLTASLTSPAWRDQYREARAACALARQDVAAERLDSLAAEESPNKERINAARWAADHARWQAERMDSESWGKEDRLKVQTVSAVRVIVETPPAGPPLPPAVTARVLETQSLPQLAGGDTGGEGEG